MREITILTTLLLMQLSLLIADDSPKKIGGTTPNIVLIMADDLGYGTLSCYGNKVINTPNIDLLAARGLRLTDYHSNGSLCSPTRAALLTGRYQQRCVSPPDDELSPVFQEQRNKNIEQRWAWGISKNELTMPELLRQAGYRTALIGKWHLGYDHKFHPMNYGFDEFRGFLGGNVDNHTHVAGYGMRELDWWNNWKIENESGYSTDLLTNYASDFIQRNKETSFFLYLAHGAVHTPLQSRDTSQKMTALNTYKEVIGILDESVGVIVKTLRDHQLEAKTLVVFCSDNGPAAPAGFQANGDLRGKKGTLYEGGHRVPLIASWPGTIPLNSTSAETVMSMDLLPTFAHLAGVNPPSDLIVDGQEITPLFNGYSLTKPRVLHWQSGDDWVVRSGPWKLTGKSHNLLSLVNLYQDIGEKDNLLNHKSAKQLELFQAHQEWIKSLEHSK